jgi:phospholipid transport system transporter-binding protein
MNNQFKLKSIQDGIQLGGSLVYANASELLQEVTPLLEGLQSNEIKIICGEVTRIDSAGIALLIEWKRWCANNNKQCKIEGLQKQANSLIETYGLQEVL